MPPCVYVALIVVEPEPEAVASPKLLTTATPGFEELHVANVVKTWLVPSSKEPVAVNC